MIYLTELSNLTEGLWWVREITGDRDLGRGPWVIAQVDGKAPFLQFGVALGLDALGLWSYPGRRPGEHPFNPSCWEFGSRIDIPSDKDRVEYAPRQAQERQVA